MNEENEVVNCIRKFNRFYTLQLGFLNQNYLGTGFSVTETRILFEINSKDGISAKELCDCLQLDKSYMSKIIRSFEKGGIISREISESDKRANRISLTEKGHTEVSRLIDTTNDSIWGIVVQMDDKSRSQVCSAMNLLIDKLGGTKNGQ